ncbi:MAG: hypothetical protein ACYDEX_19455, partial [Mobilitalea sp.]
FIAINNNVANRNLCYTAITRAKEQVIILERINVLSRILNTYDNQRRTTFLKDFFSIPVKEEFKKLFYEDKEKWNDECLIYDKNYFTFPSEKYWLANRNNCIIKSKVLASGTYSSDFTKNEMRVLELYFANIKIGDAATRNQTFDLKRMNDYRTGRISVTHLLKIAKKFSSLYITVEALRYNIKKNAAIEDEWPYVKKSWNKDGKKYLKVFDVCEWDRNLKRFVLQISDELIPYVFRIQPITGYIKEYYIEFVDRMSPKDVLLFNYFRRYIGKSQLWTYEKLSKVFRLEAGTYNTLSDFNKFFRELSKSISNNTDMKITFEHYPEKGENGHYYLYYKIDVSKKPIDIELYTIPTDDNEKQNEKEHIIQKVITVPEIYHSVRKWEKYFHEIAGTEYLRLVEKSN